MKPQNLYIHIPFCLQKCAYCAFYSVVAQNQYIPQYLQTLQQEIRHQNLQNLRSIYFGGGTPSLLTPAQISSLLSLLTMSSDTEITLEANPDTLTLKTLSGFRQAGINRLSIGMQAFQDHLLNAMNRSHSAAAAINRFHQARQAGFSNINLDVIFGLPSQTNTDWQATISTIIKLNPEHVSVYSLELDNSSLWGTLNRQRRLIPASDSRNRNMYAYARKQLTQAGYVHYEISNFAKPGYECRHNLDFWRDQPYVGVGAGAHSFIDGCHYRYESNLTGFIQSPTFTNDGKVNAKLEWLMKRFRLINGFSDQEYLDMFHSRFPKDFPSSDLLKKNRLLKHLQHHWSLTIKGLDVCDSVITQLVT